MFASSLLVVVVLALLLTVASCTAGGVSGREGGEGRRTIGSLKTGGS